MKTSPLEFARLLNESTLDEATKRAIIDQLPFLTMEQIGRWNTALSKNVEEQEKVFHTAEARMEKALLKMQIEMERMKD
jgi:hypothetical protein